MANLYSVEIQGRFNASQLQTALGQISSDKLKVNISVNKSSVQQALKEITNAKIPVTVKVTSSQVNQALKNITNAKVIANAVFDRAQVQQALNTASGNLQANVTVNAQQATRQMQQVAQNVNQSFTRATNEAIDPALNKVQDISSSTSDIVRHTEEWQTGVAETSKYTQRIDQSTGEIVNETTTITQNYKAQRDAAAKMNQLLQSRLGILKEGVTLQGQYNESDVLKALGLSRNNTTIAPYGINTTIGDGSVWDRFSISIKEANGQYKNLYANIERTTGAIRVQERGYSLVNKTLSAMGETWDRLIVKVVKWAALTTLVYLPIRAFKEVLTTLKEVDTQLVSIQKVTDYSSNQIAELTDRVYELASAYGKTADELLEVSVSFARAGFQNNLAEMTELAALVENVGYITGEEASKFLIAANAAWKLEGNTESLMEMIDGMDNVTNHAANDFESLSEGITVAGSVFANAGESAQTFTAMLGTVVATTQRSGTEVARGLRTIAMNIRQIKGELDDGEIVDEESISDAAKALNSVGVSVSENGDLRKVSDVLSDLAEKWDTLTGAEQSYLASNLAGKRQANTLVALMSNYSEYQRELQLYADGAGTALKENEIYLDSWEAKTNILKATWTDFVSGIVETDMIKGGLDACIGLLDILNNKFVQTAIQIGVVAKALDIVSKKLLLTNAAQSLGITALFGGSTAPILAVVAAIYAVSKAYDYLNVTIDEQRQKVEDLRAEYEKLYGEDSELAELRERSLDTLTAKEKARLEYLEKEAEAQERLIQSEQERADKMVRDDLADSDIPTNVDSVSDYYGTRIAKVVEQEQEMAETLERVRTEELKGIGTSKEHSSALADLITEYSDTADVLERNEADLSEQEKLWLSMYRAMLAMYSGLKDAQEAEEATEDATKSLSEKVGSLVTSFNKWESSLSIVLQAQQELNEQGYISVNTFNELAKSYPAIIENSVALANGYKVEESALGDLISSEKENANLQLYNARTAAIEYINSMSNIALQTNATTQEILDQIDALLMQREVMLSMGSSSDIYSAWLNDPMVQRLLGLKETISKARDYTSLIKKSSSSSSSTSSTAIDTINDYYNIIKHRIWLSEQLQGTYAEETAAYQAEIKKQMDYYVSLRKWAEEEASKLRQQGYAEESEEIQKLQEIWWESTNWIQSQVQSIVSQAQSAISDYLSDEKDKLDEQTDILDAQIDKYEALIDLEEKYYDIMSDIKSEQADIDKQLKVAKESYQYLDEETRKLLFNEDDYAVLSGKLTKIANESTALYEKYQKSINALTEDNIYLAEQLTTEFENQYELKQKEYEIAKAELGLAKARTTLENAQANRNTLMLVDGRFQWVADPKAVKEALEDYADAEEEYNDAIADAAHTRKINELSASKQEIATNKARLEAEYNAMSTALQKASNKLSSYSDDLSSIISEIASDAAPELKAQLLALAETLASLTGTKVTTKTASTTVTKTTPSSAGGNTITWTENSSGYSGSVSGVNTTDKSSYYVGSTAGQNFINNAPAGPPQTMGDGSTWTKNSDGSTTITKDGITYSTSSGTIKTYATGIANGVVDYTGFAMLHGSKQNPEYVLNSEQASTLLKNLSTAMLDRDTIARALGVSGKTSRFANEVSNVDSHNVIVNGMEVTGSNAERLASIMQQIVPIYNGR